MWVTNARHMRNVPGRKAEVAAAQWGAQLLGHVVVVAGDLSVNYGFACGSVDGCDRIGRSADLVAAWMKPAIAARKRMNAST
jgi:hypothetical protein